MTYNTVRYAPVLAAMLVLAAWQRGGFADASEQTRAGGTKRFVAYAWNVEPGRYENLIATYWLLRRSLDPERVKAATDAMPEGHRVLLSWDLHRWYHTNKLDYCRDAEGNLTDQPGIWWDHGVGEIAARFDEFFGRYKSIGGRVDAVVLDAEVGLSNWALRRNEPRYRAIMADPRFDPIAKQLGFRDLLSVMNWQQQSGPAQDHFRIWNALMHRRVVEYVNRAVYEPIRKHYPGVKLSNWGGCYNAPVFACPDHNGHELSRFSPGAHVGTHQSGQLYCEIGQISRRTLPGGTRPYGDGPFDGFRLSVNRMRSMVLPDANFHESVPVPDDSLLPPVPAPAAEHSLDDGPQPAAVRQAAYETPAPEQSTAGDPPPFRIEPFAAPGLEPGAERSTGVALSAIPQSAWESIPRSCVGRMLEFESVRGEYRRSFGEAPAAAQRDAVRRLDLEHIIELARLNSREYQTQKEILYRVALRLTLERYDYEMKFSPFGSGTAIDYTHTRVGGITENTLRIPSRLQAEKVLATGADLIVRFANDVVLTFNGPQGFAADVGSELLFDVSQTVFQRDVIFERLTQAERNVVYAARDFARFRKVFFFDLASRYYDLLRLYRQIEIDTQSYFTLVRALRQRQAEYDVGLVPRVQVDQVEQNALAARSALIASCNRLEGTLDALKIRMGLPTETPLGLDLTELEQLTLNDQAAVTGELVRRARGRLHEELDRDAPDRADVLSAAVELISRMLTAAELRSRLGEPAVDVTSLRVLQARLQVDEARLVVRRRTAQLDADLQDPAAPPLRILQRTLDVVEAYLRLLRRQEQLAGLLDEAAAVASIRQAREAIERQVAQLHENVEDALEALEVRRIPEFVRSAEEQLAAARRAARNADVLLKLPDGDETDQGALRRTREEVERLLAESSELLDEARRGLRPVEIGMDEAMLAALIARLDLMNERGFLADDWRQIKLAADDLKSILDLRATQRIRTESDQNRVFDFTFDDSQTRLTATFDAPLNRRAQRNNFRERLLDYQAGRRRLMEREDTIKLAVRNDLRDLELTREQYALGVASAALAYERVASTELQLRLEVEGVSARDFLEAQTAFAQSLSVVAGQHLSFLVTRARLFLDLERMELDARGFWPPVYDEALQPIPIFDFPPDGWPPYGRLPGGVHYSDEIERMLNVPAGAPGLWSD